MIKPTITFQIEDGETIQVEDERFNPTEPEDPIYNPRYYQESVFPRLCMNHDNAMFFLEALELAHEDRGHFRFEELEDILDRITKYMLSEKKPSNRRDWEYVSITQRWMIIFRKIVRTAQVFKRGVVWAQDSNRS